MIPRQTLAYFLPLALAVAGYLFFVWFLAPEQWTFRREFGRSDELIEAVEAFRSEHGRLPSGVEVLGLKNSLGSVSDEECPCYKLNNAEAYFIWFGGETLGSSLVYDSRTKSWSKSH